MIDACELTKRYGERTAVDRLSFRVGAGEVLGVLGPNGAGKTSTLRMIVGALLPTEGTVRVAGFDMRGQAMQAKRALGYMPEACPLYAELRVVEYLTFRAQLKGLRGLASRRAVERSVTQAGLTGRERSLIAHLSKGYRQRVGLADALVADPPVLVLDEPTAGLDPNQIREVRELIRSLASEHTVLLSTHILTEVEMACDRALVIHQGRLVAEGGVESLRQGAQHRSLLLLLRREDARDEDVLSDAGATLIGTESDGWERWRVSLKREQAALAPEELVRRLVQAKISVREVKEELASLEDVFSELTNEPGGARE